MELLEKLSSEDRGLIKKSWNVLAKHINDTAYCIFEMIFNQSPETKQVLESVVKSIDDPVTLDPLCDNLGRVHGRLTTSRGFKAYHWGVFIECTLFHFRRVLAQDNAFNRLHILDRAIILWRTILRILIKRMKVGLDTDLRNRQANKNEPEETSETSSQADDFALPSGAFLSDLKQREHEGLRQSRTLPTIAVVREFRAEFLECPAYGCPSSISKTVPAPDMYPPITLTNIGTMPKSQSNGILRPLRDFARRKFTRGSQPSLSGKY